MKATRLVVVDDEQDFCDLVERVAEKCGFDVFATTDPQALIAEVLASDPAVIVLDLMMPGTDGVELLRELSRLGSRAGIVLVSGLDERLIETASRLGKERGLKIAGRLHKPIPLAELRALLMRLRPRHSDLTPDDLRTAIGQDELLLHYQPRLHLASRQIVGVEALARWQHPTRGLIPPAVFIPLAADPHLMFSLTDWVFRAAIKQAADWRLQGVQPTVSINLSASDVFEYDRPDRMAELCREHGVEPRQFVLELTESEAMREPVRLMDVFTRLRLKGFALAIDDFGSGYSSLMQLQRLPFSELKIDLSFVRSMLTSEDSRIIVETILGMARNLRLVSVAEGVERSAILAALDDMKCDYAQGFHISKPVVAAQIPPLVMESWVSSPEA